MHELASLAKRGFVRVETYGGSGEAVAYCRDELALEDGVFRMTRRILTRRPLSVITLAFEPKATP